MRTNRWFYTALGVFILLFAGLVYAWSVFASSLKGYFTQWSAAQLSLTFTICMITYCIAGLICGWLKISARAKLIISGLLFFIGFYMASQANSLITLYIGYGVLAASASGFAFNTVMSSVTKFFPDKPGLISGILLMGFGFGSFFIGKIYQAVTPGGDGFRQTFFGFGILLLIVMVLCSFFIREPKLAEIDRYRLTIKTTAKIDTHDVTPKAMLKNRSFQFFFVWATVLSMSGLILISQASAIATEAKPTTSAAALATAVGLISIFNGIGRVLSGILFDKIGRLKTMLLINTTFMIAVTLIFLAISKHLYPILIVSYIFAGLAYGGITPTNSAFMKANFGEKYYAINLSIINMNLVISSFGSTISGLLYDKTNSYYSTLILMAGIVVIGYIMSFLSKSRNQQSTISDSETDLETFKAANQSSF
ncbi:MFS transporter [Agrilactobacillus yilanensis]|uniref:MFS transporter n=1 Tax=Agrilactobacillus yilanensis TaxID=2485997 RepID=A0ABW4J717_9LACO|nr:MFS transporter [Agrilactobacillus yilanensis]